MSLPENLPPELGWLRNERLSFSWSTAEMLNHYVYMLLHPDDGRIFYVGEGQGQRVFDHLGTAIRLLAGRSFQAIEEDEADQEHSEKLGTIVSILQSRRLPQMHIVRDGMGTQEEAQRVEGAIIDVLDYLAARGQRVSPLTNLQAGHGVSSFRSVEDVEATHGECFDLGDLPDLVAGDRVLFLNLNRRWSEVKEGEKSLLEATRGWWRLAPSRAAECRYVVAHAWGIVRGVFPVDAGAWSAPDKDRRIAFTSRWPAGLPGAEFVNRNVGPVLGEGSGRGSQNPVRYVRYQG